MGRVGGIPGFEYGEEVELEFLELRNFWNLWLMSAAVVGVVTNNLWIGMVVIFRLHGHPGLLVTTQTKAKKHLHFKNTFKLPTLNSMNIQYLTQLSNNPVVSDKSTGIVETLIPITMDEILTLENNYNNGNPFPVALRELLFLAGKYCYVLDYEGYGNPTDVQTAIRASLTRQSKQIDRPFFAVDAYNSFSQFLFVYLDEGVDDPIVQQARLYSEATDSSWIESLDYTLSQFINGRMSFLLSGYTPF